MGNKNAENFHEVVYSEGYSESDSGVSDHGTRFAKPLVDQK